MSGLRDRREGGLGKGRGGGGGGGEKREVRERRDESEREREREREEMKVREREYTISILCTVCHRTIHEVHLKSSCSAPGGHKPDLNVRKPSGSRPVSGPLYPLHSLSSDPPRGPEVVHLAFGGRTQTDLNVRKPSGSRPPTGREADGFRTLRSGTRPVEGARVDDFRTSWRVRWQTVHRIEIAIS